MIIRYQKTFDPDGPGAGKKVEERQSGAGDGDVTCRCKETSHMTPRELLRLMISDLAFWKKTKKA